LCCFGFVADKFRVNKTDQPTLDAVPMATFYVIPPRECLEQAVAEFLNRVLPGLPTDPRVTESILAAVEFEANRVDDVYLIHREDLPGLGRLDHDLREGYGAEPGDQVIEISATVGGCSASMRRSTLPGYVSEKRPTY
jgi:hypothetical protein